MLLTGNESTNTNNITTFVVDLDARFVKDFACHGDNFFQFGLIQLEHRGGFCDCWAVADLTLINLAGQSTKKDLK